MASYANARCLFFFLLALSFSFQTHARETKFFGKVTKTSKENPESISVSPALSPSLAPAPEPVPEVVEHGYGLYGRDPYDHYAPTTENPTKTAIFVEDEHVGVQDLGNNDTDEKFEKGYPVETPQEVRKNNYAEFQKGHSKNRNGNEYEYETVKQGMSDTRFLENGKYYYDVNQDGKEEHKYTDNEGNGNGNGNQKQGMSDTRFLENGKYYYDVNQDGKDVYKHVENEGNEEFVHLDDIRKEFENKKAPSNMHYNTNNFQNEEFLNSDPLYDTRNRNVNGESYHSGYEQYNGNTKKLPNQYDTMEEYDKEQGIYDP